ncbi:MAG: arsenate reductase/protein-tyrosine-phosphatase family protein [Acidimicrobiales bacterium]
MIERVDRRGCELLVVCTGNAARSVMAGIMLEQLASETGTDLHVVTAGTHALEGRPMSQRTREALERLEGLRDLDLRAHRSRQLTESDLSGADVVIGMEVDHVLYVRTRHESAAWKTGLFQTLAREIPPGPTPLDQKIKLLDLDHVDLDPRDDVADPAGRDADAYDECAVKLWELSEQLIWRLIGD